MASITTTTNNSNSNSNQNINNNTTATNTATNTSATHTSKVEIVGMEDVLRPLASATKTLRDNNSVGDDSTIVTGSRMGDVDDHNSTAGTVDHDSSRAVRWYPSRSSNTGGLSVNATGTAATATTATSGTGTTTSTGTITTSISTRGQVEIVGMRHLLLRRKTGSSLDKQPLMSSTVGGSSWAESRFSDGMDWKEGSGAGRLGGGSAGVGVGTMDDGNGSSSNNDETHPHNGVTDGGVSSDGVDFDVQGLRGDLFRLSKPEVLEDEEEALSVILS